MTNLSATFGLRRYAGVLLIVLLMLFASSAVFAWDDPDAASTGSHQDMFEGIVEDYGEFAFGWLGDAGAVALNVLISPFKYMILWNPDPVAMRPLVEGIVTLLAPVYIVAIMLSGFYFFFASNSPAGRARAKAMIQKLILSMILVTLSMPMYRLLLDISGAVSQRILAGLEIQASNFLGFLFLAGNVVAVASAALAATGGITALGLVIPIIIYLIIVVLAAVVVGLRIFLVYLLAALFPITLFLYFFDYTKALGEKMLNYTMGAIFTQVIMAISLAIAISCINSTDSSNWIAALFIMIIGMGAFIMIILSPLITLGLMPWIGGAIGGLGSFIAFMPIPGANIVGGVMTAVGGAATGMGPGALIAGGTVAGLGGAYAQRAASMMPQRRVAQQPHEEYDQRIIDEAKTKYGGQFDASPGTAPQMEEMDEEARLINEARAHSSRPIFDNLSPEEQRIADEAYTRYGGGGVPRPPTEPETQADYVDEEQRVFAEGKVRGGTMGGGLEHAERFANTADYYEANGDNMEAAENWEKAGEEFEKYGQNEKAAESYEKAADNNIKSGFDQSKDAAENYDAAAKNRRQINQPVEAAKNSEAAAKHWDNSASPEKAAKSLENAVEDYATMHDVHTMADRLEAAADRLDHTDAEKANAFRRQAENLRNGRDRYD